MCTQTLPNGNWIKLAAVVLCSFVPLGCAEGPRPPLSRIWGPERVIFKEVPFKDAAGRLAQVVRRDKSEESATDQAKSIAAARLGAGGANRERATHVENSQTGGSPSEQSVERNVVPPVAEIASVFARRDRSENEIVDPFANQDDLFAESVTPAADSAGVAKARQVDHVATSAQPTNPFAQLVDPSASPNMKKPALDKNPFINNVESQLERLRASVEEDSELPPIREPEAERLAAARQRVNHLMQRAASEVIQGRLTNAERTLQLASDQVEQSGIFYGPDEEQPGDLLRRVRDRIEAERQIELSRAGAEALPSQTSGVSVSPPEPDGEEVQEAVIVETADEPARPNEPPQPASAPSGSLPGSFTNVRIIPRPTSSDYKNRPMIVDMDEVPDRFAIQPYNPTRKTVPSDFAPIESPEQSRPGNPAPSRTLRDEPSRGSLPGNLPGYRPLSLDQKLRVNEQTRGGVSADNRDDTRRTRANRSDSPGDTDRSNDSSAAVFAVPGTDSSSVIVWAYRRRQPT